MNEQFSFRPVRKPNVIWIFGDQHRAHALSYRVIPMCLRLISTILRVKVCVLTARSPVRRGARLFAARS